MGDLRLQEHSRLISGSTCRLKQAGTGTCLGIRAFPTSVGAGHRHVLCGPRGLEPAWAGGSGLWSDLVQDSPGGEVSSAEES